MIPNISKIFKDFLVLDKKKIIKNFACPCIHTPLQLVERTIKKNLGGAKKYTKKGESFPANTISRQFVQHKVRIRIRKFQSKPTCHPWAHNTSNRSRYSYIHFFCIYVSSIVSISRTCRDLKKFSSTRTDNART